MIADIVLRVGLVASELEASHKLDSLLSKNGVEFAHKISLSQLKSAHCATSNLDVWLVDLKEDDWSDSLDILLEEARVPVFINEQPAIHRQSHPDFWVRKLIVRLGELVLAETEATIVTYQKPIASTPVHSLKKKSLGSSTQPEKQSETEKNQDVTKTDEPKSQFKSEFPLWVLAASLGGPASLKLFLQTLPDKVDASFVLAQHIDKNFIPVLCKIIEDYSSLKVHLPENRRPVEIGEIIIAPVESRLYFMPDGTVLTTRARWTAPYSPCIDDVMKEVAKVWDNSGAIVFSGMAGDAVEGSRAMKKAGHSVWTQNNDTCASSAMPEDVRKAGLSNLTGTPEQLARHFVAYMHRFAQAAKAL
ncbi:MAG: hypothetical protein COW84_09205 [Gammaproteobacteria bacterium CG22_combo_CG10-13_8_21_14_all_40_8]|nr:MAG: hypothetical protein COW84_09205 [Gammaproteobacteria bacterium CG22_combo_CG10-13_8_21_14_all_40_8]